MTGNHHYSSTTHKGISCLLDHPLIKGERSKQSVLNHPLNMRIKKNATGHLAAPLVFNTGMGRKNTIAYPHMTMELREQHFRAYPPMLRQTPDYLKRIQAQRYTFKKERKAIHD